MRRQDVAFAVAMFAGYRSIVQATGLDIAPAAAWAVLAAGAFGASRHWSARHPSPMPHALRWSLYLSRLSLPTRRLIRLLDAKEGERLLEIGPGIGLDAVAIAATLGAGSLDVLDVQPAMLADVIRRARRRRISNLFATRGDATRLPYADGSFDAAYVIGVLGEIPDMEAALWELRRVLRPAGRLVIGEFPIDPDFVTFGALLGRAGDAGFRFRERRGWFGYFARFDAPGP